MIPPILCLKARRSASGIVLFSRNNQNRIFLKRGGWELPSVWKTLVQETYRDAKGVTRTPPAEGLL